MKYFMLGTYLLGVCSSYAMQDPVTGITGCSLCSTSIGAGENLKVSQSTSHIGNVSDSLLIDSDGGNILMKKSQSESCVYDNNLADWLKEPLSEIDEMPINAENILRFVTANSPRLTRRNVNYENVMIYTIYSYACLNALKCCLCESFPEDPSDNYQKIIEQLNLCRNSAKVESCLYGRQCRQRVQIFSRDFLFPEGLDLKSYSRSMESVIFGWELQILSELLRVEQWNKKALGLKKAVKLFERIRSEARK